MKTIFEIRNESAGKDMQAGTTAMLAVYELNNHNVLIHIQNETNETGMLRIHGANIEMERWIALELFMKIVAMLKNEGR